MSETCPKRSGRLFAALAGALISFCALPVQAQDMARIWQDLARLDSEAALRLIEVNHPGARPELADAEFLARIDTARRHVAERLPLVRDHSGYSAVATGTSGPAHSCRPIESPGRASSRNGVVGAGSRVPTSTKAVI